LQKNYSEGLNMRNLCLLIACITIVFSIDAWAWNDDVTHPHLTRTAIQKSEMAKYLENQLNSTEGINTVLGGKTIFRWIQEGALLEDDPACRASNHFHDPLVPSWEDAGLSDMQGLVKLWCWGFGVGEFPPNEISSSVTWATGIRSPQPLDKDNSVSAFNEWDWDSAREYYYIYLTGHDLNGVAVASDKKARDAYFAYCFRALGQVLHLLQDAAVPAHVRNDFSQGHTDIIPDDESMPWEWIGNRFEHYVKANNDADWFDQAVGGDLSIVTLTNFWDTNNWDGAVPIDNEAIIGIAEFTNQNFVSEYTIFKNYTFPHESSTNIEKYVLGQIEPETVVGKDGKTDQVIYFAKNKHGIKIDHFLIPGYLTKDMFGVDGGVERTYHLDDNCFKDYAALLVPRAIGYSASVVDYFFRGSLDVDDIVLHRDLNGNIADFDISVKNTSLAGEELELMKNGALLLSYEYTIPGQEEPIFNFFGTIYTIQGENDQINSNYLTIDIHPSDPIPANVVDLKMTLIFKGSLGHEDNAIVAKVVPFAATSRIAYNFQPGGFGYESNIYTVLPDGTDEIQITNASDGLPYKFGPDWSPNGNLLAFEAHKDDPHNRNIIIIDMTSDKPYPQNIVSVFDSGNGAEGWHDYSPCFSPDGSKIVAVNDVTDSGTNLGERLIIIDVATGSWHPITEFADGYIGPPKWSPQGDKIVYHMGDWQVNDIWMINEDGSGAVNLTDDDYDDFYPAWSPDGQFIVFVSRRDGGEFLDLWIMDKSGGYKAMIADYGVNLYDPEYSPDGTRVLFTNLSGLYIHYLSNGQLRLLFEKEFYLGDMDWSRPFLSFEK
jgi:Tol biopolymer transport system component